MCFVSRSILLGIAALVAWTSPASASGGTVPVDGGADEDVIFADVQGVRYGSPPAGVAGGDSSNCTWSPYQPVVGDDPATYLRIVGGITYTAYLRTCPNGPRPVWVPQVTAQQLASAANARLIDLLPKPVMGSAPPSNSGFVKVGMWFWTSAESYRPVSVTAWIPTINGPLSVTTTGRPTALTYNPGEPDGVPVSCEGPGPVWILAYGDETPSPCMYTYVHSSGIERSDLPPCQGDVRPLVLL